jgi:Fe-S-cluster-containing hydrogenase component 2
MGKILMISPEKCTGCRSCELACSFKHEQEFNPARSRVTNLTWEKEGFSTPMMCMQCDNAACVKVCPMGAITRDEVTGAMLVNDVKCIRCKMCVHACPFGNAMYDSQSRKINKCDLCGGDPECAKNCPSGAITYREASTANISKKKAIAAKFKEIIGGVN